MTALSMVDGMVNRQAAMIAYIDDFNLMSWVTFPALPLVLIMCKADLSLPSAKADLHTNDDRRALVAQMFAAGTAP